MAAADPASRLPGLDGSTAHAVSKLYVMATTQAMWDAYQEAFKKLTSTVDGVERQAVAWPDWMPTTRIDTRAQWERVWKAVSCHDSQIAAYERLHQLSPEHHEALWGSMNFYRVFSTVNGGRRHETDLFEGLREAEPAASRRSSRTADVKAKLEGLQQLSAQRRSPIAMDADTFRALGHRLVDQIAEQLTRRAAGPGDAGRGAGRGARRRSVSTRRCPSTVRIRSDPARASGEMLFDHSLLNGHPALLRLHHLVAGADRHAGGSAGERGEPEHRRLG